MTELSEEPPYSGTTYKGYPEHLEFSHVRFWCPDKYEYIQSSAFGVDTSYSADGGQPAGIATAMTLLTRLEHPTSYHNTGLVLGRWHNCRVIAATAYGHTYREDPDTEPLSDWDRSSSLGADISSIVAHHMDVNCDPIRKLRPKRFRQLIYSMYTPETTDFKWLTVCKIRGLRDMCLGQKAGTWTKMRSWLLRQQLNNEVRRALGGRFNTKRRRKPAGTRMLRRINTGRNID